MRWIVTKGGILHNNNYTALAEYVKDQVRLTYPSFWNVVVYDRRDYNTRFYITGTYDSTHLNKRYYQILDSQPYGFSALILENNNTMETHQVFFKPIVKNPTFSPNLQYYKVKSPQVTSSQEAGIDLAITTAYTWNKNVVDFSKVLQKLIETNLNEHWEVCTTTDGLPQFALLYTSQYNQWIEYRNYGLGFFILHVYIWRNYNAG